jgi:hypothetical protein
VKILAIAGLLMMAACQRQVAVTTAPTANTPGAASAREAVQKFMAAAKAQDLQALSNIWGTTAGPARTTMGREELEQREIILLCYLKHDSYRVLSESPAQNSERVLMVETKYRELVRTGNFFATIGPANRWYVRQFDSEKFSEICSRR